MGRDNEHSIYKEKWACFGCRKCFKQRAWLEIFFEKRIRHGQERRVPCPQCGAPMWSMGWDFKVPRQNNREQWKKAEMLVRHSVGFHSFCWGQSRCGPGPRPARLRDVEPFLEKKRRAVEAARLKSARANWKKARSGREASPRQKSS